MFGGFNRSSNAAEKRNSVPAFLTMNDRLISEGLKGVPWESFALAFQLLKSDDVGSKLLDPSLKDPEARLDSVDVVACDFYATLAHE